MVIVSHDREFLDNLCTKIVETERGVATTYKVWLIMNMDGIPCPEPLTLVWGAVLHCLLWLWCRTTPV